MASGNKIFRIRVNVNDKQEVDQVIVKMGSQQCLVLKFNANDDVVVYLNNHATEMSAGFYLHQFNQLLEQSEKIAQIIALMGAQVSPCFSVSILIFIFDYELNCANKICLKNK